MKFYTVKNILSSLFLFLCFTANAQQTPAGKGSVSGKLTDGSNNQPLSFASVSIIRKSDNHVMTGMQTDIDGNFKFSNLADGIYMLKASFVGYLPATRDTIAINPLKRNYQLGAIKLHGAKGELKEVTVSAQRDQIQLGIDKKSFNVSQSIVSEGGSATDLLANVPSVQVDVDGNVSLRGSSAVNILINGKPSTLTGSNISDILQSIPASAIETIEVITNPSSKYAAEGQSGIINIVLKRNAQLGLSGSASITRGTQNTTNGFMNLAYKTKKINIYGNYGYRKGDRIGNGFINKNSVDTSGIRQYTNQISDQEFTNIGQNIRSGIDFYLDNKNTLSFSDNINLRSNNRYQNGITTITRNDTLFQKQNQNNASNSTGTNLDFNIDFEHKFTKKLEVLTANIGYSNDKSHGYDYLNTSTTNYTTPNTPPLLTNDEKTGREHSINIQSDYTLPLTNGRFEAGFRSTFDRNDNNYQADTLNWVSNQFTYSPVLSNDFVYNQNVNAVYATYQHQFGNFGIQGGMRLEDTHINTQLTSMGVVTMNHQDYFRPFPSLFLSEKLSDNQTIQLSYTRRITRPNNRELSSFVDVSNKQNYTQGNPNLLPEDTHSMELSYINYWKSVTLTSSLYYRLTNDNIQQITTPLTPNDLLTNLTTFQNIKSASNAGYELIAQISPSPVLDLTTNLNAFYSHIDSDPAYNITGSSGYAWNGNLTVGLKPNKKLRLQLRGDYQGAQVTAQGSRRAIYGMDGGIRYNVTKALTFSLNSRDIFNSRKYISDTYINNSVITTSQESQRRYATRSVMFTVSYHIGKTLQEQLQKQKDKEDKDKLNKDKDIVPDQDNPDDDMQPLNNNDNKNGNNGSDRTNNGRTSGIGNNQPNNMHQ